MSLFFARNPALDSYRAQSPYHATRAASKGSAPTMFHGGDLPPFLASGNPPSELLKLPAQLRHAAAKADTAEWARLMNEYGHDGVGAEHLMYEPAAADPGWVEYQERFAEWAAR